MLIFIVIGRTLVSVPSGFLLLHEVGFVARVQVAPAVAFGTRPTFYRCFVATFGMTPGQYRREVTKGTCFRRMTKFSRRPSSPTPTETTDRACCENSSNGQPIVGPPSRTATSITLRSTGKARTSRELSMDLSQSVAGPFPDIPEPLGRVFQGQTPRC
jgi:hypothetical protein